jgi:hypothetical protein
VEADDARDVVVADDRGLQPVVVGDLPARETDELERVVGARRERNPRQPRLEVRTTAVDEREQRPRVGLLEQAQVRTAGQVAAKQPVAPYVATVSAPSSSLIATSIE